MTHNIPVQCLVGRSWNPVAKVWDGETMVGTLIDFSMQSAEDDSAKLIPVGIVLLDTGAFQSVPMEFITKL